MGPGTRTAWQHDARRQADGTITFFDNGATPAVHPAVARDRRAARHRRARRRRCVREPRAPASRSWRAARATCRRCPTATGWSAGARRPTCREIHADGRRCCSTRTCPRRYESYRAYRLPWSGQPATPPAWRSPVRSRPAGASRLRELERRHATWPPGACSRGPRPTRSRRWRARARTGFETAISRCRQLGRPRRALLRRGAGARRLRRGHRCLVAAKRLSRRAGSFAVGRSGVPRAFGRIFPTSRSSAACGARSPRWRRAARSRSSPRSRGRAPRSGGAAAGSRSSSSNARS